MENPVDVYLPCQVFPVLVRYGLPGDISTLESLILRAVRAEEHNLDRLSYMFGVNDRMMFDALGGLWRAGHIILDIATLQVYLSKATTALFEENKLEKLALATAEFEQSELMFDLVTGRALPLDGDTAPPTSAAMASLR